MRVLIAGVGRLGEQAAHLLAATGHEVTVIERDRARLDALEGQHLLRLVHGDACEPSILESAGALNTTMLLAATGGDEDNLVIALLAKRHFRIARVLARVNDPDNEWLFDQRWGVDAALPGSAPLISLIEEAAGATDTIGLVRLTSAGITLIETRIRAESASAGKMLADLTIPAGSLIAAIVHHGQLVSPSASYRFQVGDTILIASTSATESVVHDLFQ